MNQNRSTNSKPALGKLAKSEPPPENEPTTEKEEPAE